MARFKEEVDSLFDRFFRDGSDFDRPWKGWFVPTENDFSMGWGLDVDDRENEIVVRAEAPGFDAEDFEVKASGNHLTIQAEHKQKSKNKNAFSYSFGKFHRVIPLPDGIETDKIDARYNRGVLQVTVPKDESAKGKRIIVKTE